MSGAAPPPARKRKRAKRPKLSPLFLLGSDGELYACSPMPVPSGAPVRGPEVILAIRLTRQERDVALDAIHTEGVIEAAKTLAGILRHDA